MFRVLDTEAVLSEFVLTHTSPDMFFADVSVAKESGFLNRERVVKRMKIARSRNGDWYFMDTGEFCPRLQVENLERVYKARESFAEAQQIELSRRS